MSMLNEVRPAEVEKRDRSLKGRLKELLPWKGDDVKEIIRKLVYITAMCVLIYSFYEVYVYQFGSSDMHESNDYLSNLYNQGDDQPDSTTLDPAVTAQPVNTDTPVVSGSENTGDDAQTQPDVPVNPEDLILPRIKPIYESNHDTIGWLTIDGLTDSKGANRIDHPVMQCNDNDYYLSHDFYGREKNTVRFLPTVMLRSPTIRVRKTPLFTVITWLRDPFSPLCTSTKESLIRQRAQARNLQHPLGRKQIYNHWLFLNRYQGGSGQYPDFRYHVAFDFEDNTDFIEWYANVMYRSYYTSDIPCSINDEYLTLSTCSTEIYDSRFVVVARKLRDGEDASQYTYYSNPDARKPAAFYKAYGMKVPDDKGPDYDYYKDILSKMEGNEN